LKRAFDGSQENENASSPLAGKEVYDWVKDIVTMFGKTQKKYHLMQTNGRKGQYCLIFHNDSILMLDIV